MINVKIIIGSNYGDEGKGAVVAKYTNKANNVLNILTNGGSQRGHSVVTKYGCTTHQHFGSGTYYGADTFFSRFYILNPMQFTKEYCNLKIKPQNIIRDKSCMWSTIFDMLSNTIVHFSKNTHATCGMGIWNTIKRYKEFGGVDFDNFINLSYIDKVKWLNSVKNYYKKQITIPTNISSIWHSEYIIQHFIEDCMFLKSHTKVKSVSEIIDYDNLIFENGQGLLLSDNGRNTDDTTPSNTGIADSIDILKSIGLINKNGTIVADNKITAHYVSRPYLTRHGDGYLMGEINKQYISKEIDEDNTNLWNKFQGRFRYGKLDVQKLKQRIEIDACKIPYEVELTHCDEMDRLSEFKKEFKTINVIDNPNINK